MNLKTLALCLLIISQSGQAGANAFQGGAAPIAIPLQQTAEGVWDLTWETRRGPERSGYMVIRQSGAQLRAQIYGRGAVKASGTLIGSKFTLRGSKMTVPYVLEGHLNGRGLVGSIRILSIERRFTGLRRLSSPPLRP
jgi:hypothetical protein